MAKQFHRHFADAYAEFVDEGPMSKFEPAPYVNDQSILRWLREAEAKPKPDLHHFVNPKRSLTLLHYNDEHPLSKYQSGAKA